MREKLMGMIAAAFLWHEYQLQRELCGTDDVRNRVLEAWAQRFEEGDTILTFNWDILHEAALWRAKKWHYADGYGFPCSDAPRQSRSSVRVLKLHGSVNWAQGEAQDCTPAIEHKADFFVGGRDAHEIYLTGAGTWNEGRHLIIPTYLKDLSTNRISSSSGTRPAMPSPPLRASSSSAFNYTLPTRWRVICSRMAFCAMRSTHALPWLPLKRTRTIGQHSSRTPVRTTSAIGAGSRTGCSIVSPNRSAGRRESMSARACSAIDVASCEINEGRRPASRMRKKASKTCYP